MTRKTIRRRMRLSIIAKDSVRLEQLFQIMVGIPDHETVLGAPASHIWAGAVKQIFNLARET